MSSYLLRGGDVLGATGFERGDVRVDGRITGAAEAPDDVVIEATGLIVAPGLVDLHVHVFAGQDLGVVADEIAPPAGVTTLIDTGSAGAHLIGAFRHTAVDGSRTRIRAFLNVASIGTTSILLGGELKAPHYADVDAAVAAIEANRDLVIGVKVRASSDVGGEHAPEALRRARRVADRVGLPLMVHLGPPPASIDEIADLLGPGDILTHAFTGWAGNTVVQDGALRPSIRTARDRGVVLDIGHGMSGFSLDVAREMLALGEPPDTISSDLHAYSRPLVHDLPTVLSKFLALGMPLPDVLRRATAAPAAAAGLAAAGIGGLEPGAPGDVAVFRIVPGAVDYTDGFGGCRARHRTARVRAHHRRRGAGVRRTGSRMRTVVVSGGGSGIGRAIATWFGERGDAVVVVGRRRGPLEAIVAEVGDAASLVVADLADAAGAAAVREALGDRTVDVVVPAAGGTRALVPDDLAAIEVEWRRDFGDNVLSAVLLVEALRPLLARPGARVIGLGSIGAQLGSGYGGSYGAAKAALHPWIYWLARELGPDGITANLVLPGYVPDTGFFGDRRDAEFDRARIERTLIGRASEPHEIAAAVGFLASPEAGSITGQLLGVNGGMVLGR